MQGAVEPPFGTYALPPALERLRRFGAGLPPRPALRRVTSVIRRLCLAFRADPVDVEPFPGQGARLHPRDNLSEKRVFAAPQFWDREERACLAEAMGRAPAPFHFVDAGANAGLYTLALRAVGPLRALAIEPDPENLRRLRANLTASGAGEVAVAPVALGAEEGRAEIATAAQNRGETGLRPAEDGAVRVRPLLAVVREAGFARVDALKIDIEGMEAPVLSAYLRDAPAPLWPGTIVIEAPRGADTPALALARDHGYALVRRTKLNAVLLAPARERRHSGNAS